MAEAEDEDEANAIKVQDDENPQFLSAAIKAVTVNSLKQCNAIRRKYFSDNCRPKKQVDTTNKFN